MTFYFNDGSEETTLERAFITDSATIKEVYYKSLKSADNSAQFKLPFDVELSNAIKTHNNYNTKVVVKDGNNFLFTGFLRKSANFEKTQTNQPISIELVSPSYLLSVNARSNYYWENKSVTYIVNALLELAENQLGITFNKDYSLVTNSDNVVLPIFVLEKDSKIEEAVNELLFEYGYTYNFTASGEFQAVPLFNSVSNATTLDGIKLLNSIKQTVKEEQFSKIEIEWNEIKTVSNGLIFSDTTGATGSYKCYQTISPRSYFLDTNNNLCEYDSTEGEIIYVTEITTNGLQFDTTNALTINVTNEGKHARVSVYNASSMARHITQFDLYGNAYVKKDVAITSTGDDSGETKSYSTKYIGTSDAANKLVKALKNYYQYADFTVSIQSKENLSLGSFVSVTDTGIGSITGRVTEKNTNLKTGLYSYTVEAVTEFTPATSTSVQNYVKQNSQSLLQSLNEEVQSMGSELGYVLDVSPELVTVPCDSEGNLRATSGNLTFTARLYHGAEEVTDGITKSCLVNGQGGGTWEDSIVTVPLSLITRDTNEIAITFVTDLTSKTVIVTVSKLYQGNTGESGDITLYQFALSDNAVKVDSSGTMNPTTITATKQLLSNNGILFTDYGHLYFYIDENTRSVDKIVYTQQTQDDEFDASKKYYKVSNPFLIALNEDKTKVLALQTNVAGVFWK